MKQSLIFALFFIVIGSANVTAQSACPTNFDDMSLEIAKNDVENWNGKIVSFDAQIVQIEKGYQGKPYYKIQLKDGGQIWVSSLIKSGFEIINAKLRILGYFAKIQKDNISLKFHKETYHILAFAAVELKSEKMSILSGFESQAEEWIKGKVPKGDK